MENWGRERDFGVVAEDAVTRPLGGAWCRRFEAQRPGYGFVETNIPELRIAVIPERRGEGIGHQLLRSIGEMARTRGVGAISLSVEEANPAVALYERLGYVEHSRPSRGALTMLNKLIDQ